MCLAYYKTVFDEHAKMRLVIVLFGLYFIEFEDPIVIFIMIVELKTTIGSSISMKLAYQTKTKQYNDQSHFSVFVEHGFVVSQTHTLQLRRQYIKNLI